MGLKKNSEVFSEILVGVFMVAVLAVLVYFTIIISGTDFFGGKNKIPVAVYFHDVGGLKTRDSVMLRGMVVGSVSDMQLENSSIKVTIIIQEAVKFCEGYRITVNAGSLLGGNYLLIEEGEGPELPDGTVLQGVTASNWMRDLGEIVAKLREATAGDEIKNILTNLEDATASVKELAARVEDGKGTLGKLFSEDTMLFDDLTNTVVNLKSVTAKIDTGENSLGRLINDDGGVYSDLRDSIANLKTISGRLEKGEGTIGKLLSSDDTVYRDLQETMDRIKNVAVRLDEGEGTLGKLMKDDNKVYNDLDATVENLKLVTERLAKGEGTLGKLSADDKLYNDLDATVENLKLVSERLAKGEGTLGKLSADDQLYNDIHGLIKDVRQTVDNFRDTTPISAFASLIMGGL